MQISSLILLLLCLILLAKLASWEDKRLVYLALILIVISTIRINLKQDIELFQEAIEKTHIIEVKQTSWKVDGNQLRFQGTVINDSPKRQVIVNYTIASEDEKATFETNRYKVVVAKGVYKEPHGATNKNLFDYKVYLNNQNIRQILKADVIVEKNNESHSFQRAYFFDSLRIRALDYSDLVFSPITSYYMRALLFADRSALPDEIVLAFKNLGLMHLLSISGLHISLLFGGLNASVLRLRITRESSLLIQLVLLIIYSIFTGLGVSVFRASVQHGMKCVFGLKKEFIHTLDCWSIALGSLLIINPVAVFSAGFQLSFLLSFLIIVLSNQPFFKSMKRIRQYAVLNIILFIGSIPVLSYHFFEFSFGALLFNSLYIPFISLVLLPGLIILFIVSPFILNTSVFHLFDQLLAEMIMLMEHVTSIIERTASLVFVSGRLNPLILAVWAVALILLLLEMEKGLKLHSILVYALLFISLAASNRFTPFGEIVIIDVGQGDAILIKEPFNRGVTLIDTGGVVSWKEIEEWEVRQNQYSIGSHVLAPFVKSRGVGKIDTVLITHLHYDHYGELANLAEFIPVVNIAGTIETLGHASFHEQLKRMDMETTVLKVIDQSDGFPLSDRLLVLKDSLKDKNNINNQSIVLIGKYGKLVWMFTGDIESEREGQLRRDYPNLKADVLKVAHHGSASSSTAEFINHIKPDYALISVGSNNRYDHPNLDVLERLEHNQIQTFRTDYHGSIHFKFSDSVLLDKWINKDEQIFQTNSQRGDNE